MLLFACERTPPDNAASPQPQPTPTTTPEPTPTPDTPQPTPEARNDDIEYVERVLGDADPEQPLPMLIAIHGLGDEPEHFGQLFDGLNTPVRLILPRGIDPYPQGGYSWFPLRARSEDVDGLSQGIDHAGDELAKAIEEAAKTRPTLGKPILTGFSQGGMLTFAIAIDHPDTIGAAFPLGGWLPPPLWPDAATDKLPIVAFHGIDDQAVPYPSTKDAVTHLQQLGYDVELKAYPDVGHQVTPTMRDELFAQLRTAIEKAAEQKPVEQKSPVEQKPSVESEPTR